MRRLSTFCSVVVLAVALGVVYFCAPWAIKIHSWIISRDQRHEKCLDFSPAFPSAGGPGCKTKCSPKDGHRTSGYAAIYLNKTHKWPSDLLDNMHRAGTILKKYGAPRSLDTERPVYLHVTFDYYCCYTESEAVKIGQFLNSYTWAPQEVWFDRMVCAIHSNGDMVSLVLMVNEDSEKKLLKLALENELDLEKKTGIHKHIPHNDLQGFHMTLATVNQSEFLVRPALEEINRVIAPGKWHVKPVVLHRPVCRKCDRLISAVKVT